MPRSRRHRATARPAAPALAALVGVVLAAAPARADWPTARGNVERTGNVDGRAGPEKPKVLWTYQAQEHFIGSPVPSVLSLYVPALGAFNTGVLHCLDLETDPPQRGRWSKAAPLIKRPTVCSPAVIGGLVVFGDGMHQTDDAILYCVHAETGRGIWQYAVPGKLVHMEGSPTIAGDLVYIGGGDAGMLCVRLKHMVLDGKELDFEAVKTLLAQRWKELVAQYEQDKKKDPEFAIPPSEDALPKPAPKLVWQAGKGEWHVDAPAAVARNRLLVASAYLDLEKCGKRALLCLRPQNGSVAWEVPLKINPWAGVTVAGRTALVGCSTIRYDRKAIPTARGEVVAVDVNDGRVRWRKDVPGGVLSTIACKDGLAVFAATDGKVRAWDAATGREKWLYDAGSPFFAGPAIAGGVVYAADLKAVVHAVALADGARRWRLDLAADARASGAVFGSPVVHGGRIYLGTCDPEAGLSERPSAVVCIADERAAAREKAAGTVTVDAAARTVSVPCRIAPRKLPHLKEAYPIEVMATLPHPRGQKAHETVVTIEVRPSDVHKALESLGLRPGKPARGETGTTTGPEVRIALALPLAGGGRNVLPIARVLVDRRTGRAMPPLRWYFTGSARKQPDPDKPFTVYGADVSGTLIALFPVTDETVFQSNMTMREESLLKIETNRGALPAEHTPATLILQPIEPRAAAPATAPTEPPRPGDVAHWPLPCWASAPRPCPSDVLARTAGDAPLPPLHAETGTVLLAVERRRPLRPRTPAALPAPASLPEATLALRRPLAVGPLETAPSPDPDRLPKLVVHPAPAYRRADGEGDRIEGPLRRAVLREAPGGRETRAAFLPLFIPRPVGELRHVRLRRAIPDDDPPAADGRVPKRPTLPVAKPDPPAKRAR